MLGIQLPGRENRVREPLRSNLSDVLDAIVGELAPTLQDEIPFVFFGHSLGALLAFEVARRFRRERLDAPAVLIVSGRTPPHLPSLGRVLHRLSDDDLLREVVRLDGIPLEIQSQPEMCSLILGPLRADLKLDETYAYSPEPPLECPILACVGRNDPEAPLSAMQEWRACTSSRFVFRAFEGRHFFMYPCSTPLTIEIASFVHSVLGATAKSSDLQSDRHLPMERESSSQVDPEQ